MTLKSPDAPQYLIRSSRCTWKDRGSSSVPGSTSAYLTCALISGAPLSVAWPGARPAVSRSTAAGPGVACPAALHDRGVRGAHVLAVYRRDLRLGREQHVAARLPDIGDRGLADEDVARVDGTAVLKALLAVHDHRVVDAEPGIHHRAGAPGHADHDGERGRCGHVRVTRRLGRRAVPVHRVLVADRARELSDLHPADLVRLGRRVCPAEIVPVDSHPAKVTERGSARVSETVRPAWVRPPPRSRPL